MRLNYFSGDGRDSGAVYVDAKAREERLVNGLIAMTCNAGRAQEINISHAVKSAGYAAAGRKSYKFGGRTHSLYGKKSKRPFVPTWCKFCGAAVAYGTISKMRLRSATAWIDTCDGCAASR